MYIVKLIHTPIDTCILPYLGLQVGEIGGGPTQYVWAEKEKK